MTIRAATVRYIKLGKGGVWESALDRGELPFGYAAATHELALEGNLETMKQLFIKQGRSPQAAARDAREVADFYQLGADCLWITFARDHLWWAFADPEVIPNTGNPVLTPGERVRKTIDGGHKTDVNGVPLRIDSLNTRLTKVAAYRRTICAVDAHDYLLRRINGLEEPILQKGATARRALIEV
jgi:hypothetical protein